MTIDLKSMESMSRKNISVVFIVNPNNPSGAFTEKNRSLIKSRMKEILLGLEKTFKAKIKLDYEDGYPPVINHKKQTDSLKKSAEKFTKVGSPYLTMGGEDFSYFLNMVPGCFFFLGSNPNKNKKINTPHHCSHFDIDENALILGSSIFVQLIEDIL